MDIDSFPRFMKYVPMLNKTNSLNYTFVLAKVLHECLHQIPLEDFLNFILTLVASEKEDQFCENHFIKLDLDSLKLCHLILQSFRLPKVIGNSFSGYSINNSQLLSIKFDQIVRTFLAIKIILDTIIVIPHKPIDDSLSRTSVYKAYYIIWHKHINKQPSFQIRLKQKYPAISISSFGKLMKLIYPDITEKRLGRRGESTYHYLGVKWNDNIIDSYTKDLMKHTLPHLKLYFKDSELTKLEERNHCHIKNLTQESHLYKSDYIKPASLLRFTTKKPLYSFVNLESSLPSSECFPCSWNTEVPQQSEWSKEKMQKSVKALKEININVKPLVEKFSIDMFYYEYDISFFDEVIQIIHLLFDRRISGEAYLHLYLVVSLLIFPMLLADEKGGSNIVQIRLCEYLDIFLARLESEFVGLPLYDFCNLMCFFNIMKEMSGLTRLLVIRLKTALTKQVVKAMVNDVQSLTAEIKPKMSEVIYRSIIILFNAFNGGSKDDKEVHSTIEKLVAGFLQFCIAMVDDVGYITESMDNEDSQNPTYNLCFQSFKVIVKNFVEICMEDSAILLPARITSFIFMDMLNEIQHLCLTNFANRDNDVSKESFKTWWACSVIVQKLISILSEVKALSAHLDTV